MVAAERVGDALRQRYRLAERCPGGDDAVDEPDSFRPPGVDHLAGERHLHRVFSRDGATDRDKRRRTEEADIDAGQGETAVSPAIARSQVATSWQPAAVATPSTAAITGFPARRCSA